MYAYSVKVEYSFSFCGYLEEMGRGSGESQAELGRGGGGGGMKVRLAKQCTVGGSLGWYMYFARVLVEWTKTIQLVLLTEWVGLYMCSAVVYMMFCVVI